MIKRILKKALKWMEGVVRRDPNDALIMDTYANLLYKIGRGKEAIEWEEKAVELAPEDKELRKL